MSELLNRPELLAHLEWLIGALHRKEFGEKVAPPVASAGQFLTSLCN